MLKITKVTKRYGNVVALKEVDLEVKPKQIVGLIGPNGAGKTTLLSCIMGRERVDAGNIIFLGTDITNWKPYKICRLGLNRTHQLVKTFDDMSVSENVLTAIFYGQGKKYDRKEAEEEANNILNYLNLRGVKNVQAKDLTFALKRKLEVARALATKPKLILLDEVLAGLTPAEMEEVSNLICKLRDEMGITILWVEHVLRVIMKLAEYIYVLNFGIKIAEGPPTEIVKDELVREAYIGRGIR